MILLQLYLYAYSLLRGATFEVLPLSNYALNPTMLPGTVLSNTFQCRHFFKRLQYPEIFVHLKLSLIL
jgi:hypothetical protein